MITAPENTIRTSIDATTAYHEYFPYSLFPVSYTDFTYWVNIFLRHVIYSITWPLFNLNTHEDKNIFMDVGGSFAADFMCR